MINGGKVNLNENSVNNLSILSEYSKNKRDNTPKILNNTMAYLFNSIKKNQKKFKNKNPNINESRYFRNQTYNSFLTNTNDYNTPTSQIYIPESNYNFSTNYSQNTEEELFIQKIKDLIEQRERNKVQKIINQYYKQNYADLMKKNVDSYQNGINLSISNCETQYPINYLNDDEFFNRLSTFLEELEMNKKKNQLINNTMTRSNTSYNLTEINSNKKKKNYSFKTNYINEPFGEERMSFEPKYCYDNDYFNKTNNNFNKKYNLSNNNFFKRNKNNEFELETNEYEINKSYNDNEDNDNSNISIRGNSNNKYYKSNTNKYKLKNNIGNILNENKNNYKKYSQQKNKIKKKLIDEKNFKEYKFQEKFILKIKKFIEFLERCYILSINKFFHYFIEQLQLYNKSKFIENKDSINLLKRFQKLNKSKRKININKNYTKYLSLNNELNNNSNNSFNISNNISIIDSYKKNKHKFKNICKSRDIQSIYIPKNKKKQALLTENLSSSKIIKNNLLDNKDINLGLYSNITKNTRYSDNKLNLSNEDNSKILLYSNNTNNLLKTSDSNNISKDKESTFSNYKRKNNRSLNYIFKNNLTQSLTSFYNKTKADKLREYENNFNDNINSKEKPIIYVKPKTITKNFKKELKKKEKDVNDKKDFNIKIDKINNKESNKNSDYIYKGKNYLSNNNSNNSSINKELKNLISPIKSEHVVLYKNKKNFQKIKDNEDKKNQKIIKNKNAIEEVVIKDIVSNDKKLRLIIKYLTSEISKEKFLKMKIRKRLLNLNLKDNKNISSNNDLKSLKINHIESIELTPLLTLKNVNIKINYDKNKKEEKKENNLNKNSNYKNIKMNNILQNLEKQNILYFYRYFFNIMNNQSHLNETSLFNSKIFKKIKKNFKGNNLNTFNISNNIEKLDKENFNENNTNNENNNSKNKINYDNNKKSLKRNLFPDKNIRRTISEDNICNNDYKQNKLNKSDMDEINDFSLNEVKKSFNITETDYFPKKKSSFRLKITKFKIFREKVEEIVEKKYSYDKLDILKEEKEMRKKNKIIFLLTNNFSNKNNCLRIIRKYFHTWKSKYFDNEDKNINNSEIKINNSNNDNNIIKDENSKILIDEVKTNEIKEKKEIINEVIENNINKENQKENDINYNIPIKLGNDAVDAFKNPLNYLNEISNEEREINSDKNLKKNKMEEDNSIRSDLEEILKYFRINLIYHFLNNNNYQNLQDESEKN